MPGRPIDATIDVLAPEPTATGDNMKVMLACPECGEQGWVPWKDLSFGLRCPKCACKFLLNRSGKLQSLAELPHISYTCPRCRQSGSLPEVLAVRAVECTTCKLPLVRNAENGFQPIEEPRLPQMPGKSAVKTPVAGWSWESLVMDGNGKLRKANLCVAGLVVLAILWGGSRAVGRLFDSTPHNRARAMTYACLADDRDAAAAYLPDEPLQRVEFERWKVRYFPSILDKHRPGGDRVAIAVDTIRETPDACVLQVTMTSKFITKRACQQQWRKTGGVWQFDPVATLRAQE